MMRTTILIGLCCTLAAPADANTRPAIIEFGEFCKTTTSLVPCTFDDTPNTSHSITGRNPSLTNDFLRIDRHDASAVQGSVQVAESGGTEKGLAQALKEYIDGLLGKKPAPKPEPEKPEATSQESAKPEAAESEANASVPETTSQPSKADIDKALSGLLAERETWGTAPSGAAEKESAAPAQAAPAASDSVAQPSKSDIDKALSDLLSERESWGTKPSGKSDSSNAAPSTGASTSTAEAPTGDPTLATASVTGNLSDFISLRESWGTMKAKPVSAPLAKNAPRKFLPDTPSTTADASETPVIINPANLPPVPQPSLVSQADIVRARNALLEQRAGWGAAPSTPAASVTGDLPGYLERRDRWGNGPAAKEVKAPLAKGAVKKFETAAIATVPSGPEPIVHDRKDVPLPTLAAIPASDITSALKALLSTREGWGGQPSVSTRLVAGDLNAYFDRRDGWGKAPPAKPIKAPLAKGASKKLKLSENPKPTVDDTPVIINALEPRPLPEVAALPGDQIAGAMKALLAEREGWGTAPAVSGPRFAGDLKSFLSRREGWGTGGPAKEVIAPLAKGAPRKLKLAKTAAAPGNDTPVIVNEPEARALPEVAAIPGDQIADAMKALLSGREAWGTEPSMSGPRFAGDLNRYFARRDSWGKGPKAKKISAPLAKGATKKVRLAVANAPSGDGKPPIINELLARPLPEIAAIPGDQIADAMKALLSERTGWGTEPNISEARVAGDLNAFLSRRDRWGTGAEPKNVKAPLAKGASRKLKLSENPKPVADDTTVIIHEMQARPLPEMAAIPGEQIVDAMKTLLYDREAWGTEPAMSGPRFAGDLSRYFARRDSWGKGPKAKKISAPLAKGASRKLRLAKASVSSSNGQPPIINELQARPLPEVAAIPGDQIADAMTSLLSAREGWGNEPSMSAPAAGGGAVVAEAKPKSNISQAERTRCSDELNALASKRTILFANGSAELNSSSNDVLTEIASTIKRCGDISVRIEGHTDSSGGADSNQKLSESRANSVLKFLTGTGIEGSKLSAVGYGETKPVASNATRESRALNRRIEFAIE